ncbi:hypothetical protein GDO81_017535 [Engystomops pustulosus]|uniref:Uncharacterized protein n=1 Tax=Engystomops pustulosus TaxID=76066 RepID=A0AAV7A450_ENGPU|nr:hypothetical protein GDO81_017535 [Engystomops pustulosus]
MFTFLGGKSTRRRKEKPAQLCSVRCGTMTCVTMYRAHAALRGPDGMMTCVTMYGAHAALRGPDGTLTYVTMYQAHATLWGSNIS